MDSAIQVAKNLPNFGSMGDTIDNDIEDTTKKVGKTFQDNTVTRVGQEHTTVALDNAQPSTSAVLEHRAITVSDVGGNTQYHSETTVHEELLTVWKVINKDAIEAGDIVVLRNCYLRMQAKLSEYKNQSEQLMLVTCDHLREILDLLLLVEEGLKNRDFVTKLSPASAVPLQQVYRQCCSFREIFLRILDKMLVHPQFEEARVNLEGAKEQIKSYHFFDDKGDKPYLGGETELKVSSTLKKVSTVGTYVAGTVSASGLLGAGIKFLVGAFECMSKKEEGCNEQLVAGYVFMASAMVLTFILFGCNFYQFRRHQVAQDLVQPPPSNPLAQMRSSNYNLQSVRQQQEVTHQAHEGTPLMTRPYVDEVV